MKIVHLITSLEGGGSENYLHQLVSHSPAGYRHEIIYLKKEGIIGQRFRQLGIPVRRLGIPQLWSFLRAERPPVLHTCLYRAHQIGRLIGHWAGVPTIISSQQAIDTWQKPWLRWLDTLTLPYCSCVTVNSSAAQKLVGQRRGPRPAPRIVNVVNGVDLDRFVPQDRLQARRTYQLPENVIVGGALGRLHSEKGADWIPRFAHSVLPQRPNLHLLIGGTGPFEADLKRRTQSTPYADRLHWVGWQENVPQFLAALDFMWLLSREESLPQILVEASALGVPWMAPDVGGIADLLVAGAVGFLYKPGDLSHAEQTVSFLMEHHADLLQKARTQMPRLRAEYSLEKMIQQFYVVLRSIRPPA